MSGSPNRDFEESQVEKKLREQAAHLQSLITSLEDIVFEIDANQTFKNVWVSDERILFMPREQFLGKKIADVMGSQAAIFTEPVKEAVRKGVSQELVYHHIDANINKWYKAKIKPVFISSDPGKYILTLSIQNVTEQKLAEIALEEAKDKLEFAVQLLDVSQELSKTAGWELDLSTLEVFCTRQAYTLFDLPEDFKFTFQNTRPFFVGDDFDILMNHAMEAATDKKSYNAEVRIITAKGVKKWVYATGIPVIKGNIVIKLRGALMDITSNKGIEQELIDAKNEAEYAFNVKSDFLSIMSHEIRTPLNCIIGITNLLKLDHVEKHKEYIDNLTFSANHLLSLINNILDLTKIESGQVELVNSEVNLIQLTENIKNQFDTLAADKGIKLESMFSGDIPEIVIADPIRLGQILNNLLGNAVKFTDQGVVTLLIELVSNNSTEVNIRFTVKDTGIGIPESLHESVFENFKQVQQSPYRKHTGTGLGLAITKKLLKLYDSNITLKSKPGLGTEFQFEVSFGLPQNQVIVGSKDIPDNLTDCPKELSGLRTLIVEDNIINMMVAKKQLEYFGIKPDCAGNGAEALELLNTNSYHVALVDLHMPDIDGYMLAGLILKQFPDTHIVIFTADIMTEVKTRFANMGIYDILSKPFNPESMYKILLNVSLDKIGD